MAFTKYSEMQVNKLADALEGERIQYRFVTSYNNITPSVLVFNSHSNQEYEIFAPDGENIHHFIVMDEGDDQVCFTSIDDVLMFLWGKFHGDSYKTFPEYNRSNVTLKNSDTIELINRLGEYIANISDEGWEHPYVIEAMEQVGKLQKIKN